MHNNAVEQVVKGADTPAQQDFEQVAATIRRWQAEGREPQLMSLYQLLNQEPEPRYTITAKGRAYLAAVRS